MIRESYFKIKMFFEYLAHFVFKNYLSILIYLLPTFIFIIIFYIRKKISQIIIHFMYRFFSEQLVDKLSNKATGISFALETIISSMALYPLYNLTQNQFIYNLFFTFIVLGGIILCTEIMRVFFLYARDKSEILKEADTIDLTNFLIKIIRLIIVVVGIFMLIKQYSQDDFQLSSLIYFLSFLTAGISFAARDYIGNFFGAIGILISNPFSKGEKISIYDIEGKIESFGFQQTIMRQKDQSLVYIPNAKLMTKGVFLNKSRKYFQSIFVEFLISSHTKEELIKKSFEEIYATLLTHPSMIKNNKPEAFIKEIFKGLFKINVITLAKNSENDDLVKQEVILITRNILIKNHIHFAQEPMFCTSSNNSSDDDGGDGV